MEQTLHHPPAFTYQIISPEKKFEINGFGTIVVSIEGLNAIRGWREGKNFLKFDDGTTVTWNNLKARVTGILMGERVYNFVNELVIQDLKNQIECKVSFHEPINEGIITKLIYGKKEIQYDEAQIEISKINENDKEKEIVATGYASWIGQIYFGDECFWSVLDKQQKWERNNLFILPSDGRLRTDLIYILSGDFANAQKEKDKIEDIQRRDQKLREKFANNLNNK